MPTPLNHPLPDHWQHDPTPKPHRSSGSRMQEDLAALEPSSEDTLLVLREHMRVSRAPCGALPGLYLPLVAGRYNSVDVVCVTDLYLWHLLRGHATHCAATATAIKTPDTTVSALLLAACTDRIGWSCAVAGRLPHENTGVARDALVTALLHTRLSDTLLQPENPHDLCLLLDAYRELHMQYLRFQAHAVSELGTEAITLPVADVTLRKVTATHPGHWHAWLEAQPPATTPLPRDLPGIHAAARTLLVYGYTRFGPAALLPTPDDKELP